MIDLIGFWFNVTIILSPLFLLCCLVMHHILYHLVREVIQDNSVADHFMFTKVYGTEYTYSARGTVVHLFGRWTFGKDNFEGWFYGTMVSGFLCYLPLLAYARSKLNWDILKAVSNTSELFAPYTSWMFISVILYWSLILVLRQVYKIGKALTSLSDKFNKHVADKEAHND